MSNKTRKKKAANKQKCVTRVDPYTNVELPFTRKCYKPNTLLYLDEINGRQPYRVRPIDAKDVNNEKYKYRYGFVYLSDKDGWKPTNKWFAKQRTFKASPNGNGNGKARQGKFVSYLYPNKTLYTQFYKNKGFIRPLNPKEKRYTCNYVTGLPDKPVMASYEWGLKN